MAALTQKQENFVKNIVFEGMTYSDAYRSAYSTSKMSDKTINEKASALANDGKITARMAELRDKIDSPKIMSATRRAERLSEIAEKGTNNECVRAIGELNKMFGDCKIKVETTIKRKLEDLIQNK